MKKPPKDPWLHVKMIGDTLTGQVDNPPDLQEAKSVKRKSKTNKAKKKRV